MDRTLTLQQLRNNSYHLAIRSSLLAIQSILSLQETMLQSQHSTFMDIKSTITSQNATLRHITKTLAETFSKISSYQPPSLPQLGSAVAPQKLVATTTATATISVVALPLRPPSNHSSPPSPSVPCSASNMSTHPPTVSTALNPHPPLPLCLAPSFDVASILSFSSTAPATTPASTTQTTSQSSTSASATTLSASLFGSTKPFSLSASTLETLKMGTRSIMAGMAKKWGLVNHENTNEIAPDSLHKSKFISGFYHLYASPEVVKLYDDLIASYEHILLDLMLERYEKIKFGNGLFVFDPGGTILDLEDKVVLEATVMIRILLICAQPLQIGRE